jgi:hypothetical protein
VCKKSLRNEKTDNLYLETVLMASFLTYHLPLQAWGWLQELRGPAELQGGASGGMGGLRALGRGLLLLLLLLVL